MKSYHEDVFAHRLSCNALQKSFKDFVGAVIAHKNAVTGVYYRDEPTIMAWEIANSPVCPGDDSGDILQASPPPFPSFHL